MLCVDEGNYCEQKNSQASGRWGRLGFITITVIEMALPSSFTSTDGAEKKVLRESPPVWVSLNDNSFGQVMAASGVGWLAASPFSECSDGSKSGEP